MSAQPTLTVVDDATAPDLGSADALADRARAHAVRRSARREPLAAFGPLGPLAVRDADIPALARALGEGAAATPGSDSASDAGAPGADGAETPDPLGITVVVGGGAGAIEPATRWVDREPRLRLQGLVTSVRDLDDLARGAHRVAAMVQMLSADGVLDEDVVVEVGLPLDARGPAGARWEHALDTLALEDLRLALRTGGAWSEVPDPATLAAAIGDALDREIAFVCHGGLERAVAADSGSASGYGFADVLLATRASLDGASADEVAERLTEARMLESTRAELEEVGGTAIGSASRWFTAFSSVDVETTLTELDAVGLRG